MKKQIKIILIGFVLILLLILIQIMNQNKKENFKNLSNLNTLNSSNFNNIFNNIYCINLKRSKDRWDYIQKVGREQNIDINRFDATDGKNLSLQKAKNMCSSEYYEMMKNNKSLLANIGCYNSHLNLLKKIHSEKIDNALIIEDDIIFPNNFKQLLQKNLEKVPSDWDIIYLGVTRPCGKLYKENIYIPSIIECSKDNGGLFGYMVNNRSAGKIYNLINKKINKMVDHAIRDFFPVLKVYIIYPFLINHNYNLISDRKYSGYYNKNYIDASNIIKIIN